MSAESSSVARRRGAVEAYFTAVRSMDLAAVVAAFAQDALTFDPETEFAIEGHAELRAYFQRIWAGFERNDQAEEATFFSHEGAAVKWTCAAVLDGGGEVAYEGIDVFEINPAGTIQTLWTYRDDIPAPAPRGPGTRTHEDSSARHPPR